MMGDVIVCVWSGNFTFQFYMYEDPVVFQWKYLVQCYRQENNGINPWADEVITYSRTDPHHHPLRSISDGPSWLRTRGSCGSTRHSLATH